jgi:hypothetical protein
MAVINNPFLVTGGETNRPPSNAFSPSQRQINIRAPFSVPSADRWTNQKVWLLIPGFTAASDSFDATLATAINDANPNDTVLALDWTQVSGTPTNNTAAGIADRRPLQVWFVDYSSGNSSPKQTCGVGNASHSTQYCWS